jgi:hypothetical protein
MNFSLGNVFKSLIFSLCSVLLLTGCGSSAPEASLIESCEKLNLNLISLSKGPELFKVKDPSEKLTDTTNDLYFITNVGNSTRERNKDVITNRYPFLSKYFANAMYMQGTLENDVELAILTEAIKNTGFEISLTASQISAVKGDYEDPSFDVLQDEIERIIGADLYDENDNFIGKSGCANVSTYKYDLNQEDPDKHPFDFEVDDTDLLWSRAINTITWAYEVVTFTNICQRDGDYLGNECARDDYVSKVTYDDSLPAPAPVDPWTRSWSSREQEELAKTVWCINKGYRNYNYASDSCTNTVTR